MRGAPDERPVRVITTPEIQLTGSKPPTPAASIQPTAAGDHGFRFHDLLSAMNPLQYLPIVGTIYRAVTGDVIPETVRRLGSLVVSGLLGGPIGLATNVVSTIAEEITGIDPEKIIAAHIGMSPKADAAPGDGPMTAARTEVPGAAGRSGAAAPTDAQAAAPAPAVATQPLGWTAEQLAAYGVRTGSSGDLKLGNVEGADVLNTMELSRLSKAAAAYAANQASLSRSG